MAVLRIPDEDLTIESFEGIKNRLDEIGITYETWEPQVELPENASSEQILDAYQPQIERLKREGGYVTADVIDVRADTPNIDAMLSKFDKEHWHDEDEVRFCIEGRGIFHINPEKGPVVSIEMHAGDLIRVPRGTHHWFNLCIEKRIRAIRLFQDPTGWTPHYTDSGKDQGFQPLCMGPNYIPPVNLNKED